MPTEIKIDPSTLPQDGQFVKWQTTKEDGSNVWNYGSYCNKEKLFFYSLNDISEAWDSIFEVVHWEAIPTLHLNVHKQAFEVMVSGEKRVEFRKPSDWINSRLFNKDGSEKVYNLIKITHSYGADKPSFVAPFLGFSDAKVSTSKVYSNGLAVDVEKGDYIICFGDIIKKENV